MVRTTGTRILLSEALARVPDERREAELRRLVDEIAAGRLRIRYFNYGDLSPETLSPETGEIPPSPRPPHREEPLPEHFFRLGSVDHADHALSAAFSAVSFGGRTIHGIELFVPDGGEAVAIDRPPGRPSSKELIEAEGQRLLAGGVSYRTLGAFASEVRRLVLEADPNAPGTALRTVRRLLDPLWRRRK